MNYLDIKSEYVAQHDSGDQWGSAMSARFDICETLTRRGDDVPASWEFHAGAGLFGIDDEPESYFGCIIRDADSADLVRFGNVLARYTNALRLADLDY